MIFHCWGSRIDRIWCDYFVCENIEFEFYDNGCVEIFRRPRHHQDKNCLLILILNLEFCLFLIRGIRSWSRILTLPEINKVLIMSSSSVRVDGQQKAFFIRWHRFLWSRTVHIGPTSVCWFVKLCAFFYLEYEQFLWFEVQDRKKHVGFTNQHPWTTLTNWHCWMNLGTLWRCWQSHPKTSLKWESCGNLLKTGSKGHNSAHFGLFDLLVVMWLCSHFLESLRAS